MSYKITMRQAPDVSEEERERRLAACYRIILERAPQVQEKDTATDVREAGEPGTSAADQTLASPPETT